MSDADVMDKSCFDTCFKIESPTVIQTAIAMIPSKCLTQLIIPSSLGNKRIEISLVQRLTGPDNTAVVLRGELSRQRHACQALASSPI